MSNYPYPLVVNTGFLNSLLKLKKISKDEYDRATRGEVIETESVGTIVCSKFVTTSN